MAKCGVFFCLFCVTLLLLERWCAWCDIFIGRKLGTLVVNGKLSFCVERWWNRGPRGESCALVYELRKYFSLPKRLGNNLWPAFDIESIMKQDSWAHMWFWGFLGPNVWSEILSHCLPLLTHLFPIRCIIAVLKFLTEKIAKCGNSIDTCVRLSDL